MLVFEFKLKGKEDQYRKIDEAIRTGQFIRNACLKYWQENKGTTQNDLRKYCAILAANPDFPWAGKLNSQARQSHADRTWCAIKRFYENCKNKIPGKKGYPKFKKNSRSVEYKTTGWKLSEDRKRLTLKDGFKAGPFKLLGSRDLHFSQIKQIKQVRIIKRADGYSAQFVKELRIPAYKRPGSVKLIISLGSVGPLFNPILSSLSEVFPAKLH